MYDSPDLIDMAQGQRPPSRMESMHACRDMKTPFGACLGAPLSMHACQDTRNSTIATLRRMPQGQGDQLCKKNARIHQCKKMHVCTHATVHLMPRMRHEVGVVKQLQKHMRLEQHRRHVCTHAVIHSMPRGPSPLAHPLHACREIDHPWLHACVGTVPPHEGMHQCTHAVIHPLPR